MQFVSRRLGGLRMLLSTLRSVTVSRPGFYYSTGKELREYLYSKLRMQRPIVLRFHFKPISNGKSFSSVGFENAVSYEELKALIEAHDVILIDVRDPEEIEAQGRIIGAVNVPLGQLPEAFEMTEERFFEKYNFEKPHTYDANVIFHGLSHIKSTAAIEIAHKHGFTKTRHFPGGWAEWIRREKSEACAR